MTKKTVACFTKNYLPLSEIFIYNEIKNLRKFKTIVLTKNLIPNPLFPFEPVCSKPSEFQFILEKHRVQLIHAHFGEGGMLMLPLAQKLKVPLLTTFHGIDISRYPRYFMYRQRLKKLLKRGKFFLVRSKKMQEDVIELGCQPDKVQILYGGIDINKFKFSARGKSAAGGKAKEKAGHINILMCGRFVEKKGFEYGIRAFSRVKNETMRLTIIGDGKFKDQLQKLTTFLGVSDRVHFLGRCSQDRVAQELQEADIFLAPHCTARNGDQEGIPNTIKEAMATGLPVVSTYHAGIPELVDDGKSGFLVPERDSNALAERINWLILHPETRKKLSSKGRKTVVQKFNLFKQIEKLEEIYERLIL